jgi:hypothetical protein
MKTRQVSSLILGHRNTDGQAWTPHKVDDGEYALDVNYALVMILSLYSSRFVTYSHPAVSPLFFVALMSCQVETWCWIYTGINSFVVTLTFSRLIFVLYVQWTNKCTAPTCLDVYTSSWGSFLLCVLIYIKIRVDRFMVYAKVFIIPSG